MNESSEKIKTVAITGASGLLGRHLCDYFRRNGWKVHALVRDTTKYPYSERGIIVYKCDLPDTIDLKGIESADVLIHSAYMTRFTNLDEAERVNEQGTVRLYEAARNAGVSKFVFVSSRAARPNAQSYYGQSKYKLESRMDTSRDLIIRPGLILASEGGLFHRMVNQVQRLPLIPVFGGGNQKLNTVHIDDLCEIFGWALEKRKCGVITVAESEGITMKELLRTILEQIGKRKLIVSVPGRPFVLLLQLLEFLKLKLPISSENLRGLLSMEDSALSSTENLDHKEVRIRPAHESIKSLIRESNQPKNAIKQA